MRVCLCEKNGHFFPTVGETFSSNLSMIVFFYFRLGLWFWKEYDRMIPPVCGLEYFMDSLLDYMQTEMWNVWNNTLIIFTSDNGSLSHGSCNYSLRGGNNAYFDDNQQSHAFD